MGKQVLDEFKEDFPMLIEAGFVAVKQLDEKSARALFEAAQLLSEGSTAPQIGLGYIALNKLEVPEATEIFKKVVDKEPDNHLAVAFLGICHLLTKDQRSEGEKLIKRAMEESSDETVKNLGQVALEWADKDLKNLKSPFIK